MLSFTYLTSTHGSLTLLQTLFFSECDRKSKHLQVKHQPWGGSVSRSQPHLTNEFKKLVSFNNSPLWVKCWVERVLQEWHMISKLGYKKHDTFICWKKKETDARLSVPLYQQFTAILLVWGGPKRLNMFETTLWPRWVVNLSFTSSQ